MLFKYPITKFSNADKIIKLLDDLCFYHLHSTFWPIHSDSGEKTKEIKGSKNLKVPKCDTEPVIHCKECLSSALAHFVLLL